MGEHRVPVGASIERKVGDSISCALRARAYEERCELRSFSKQYTTWWSGDASERA
jgi:hypothetical protein